MLRFKKKFLTLHVFFKLIASTIAGILYFIYETGIISVAGYYVRFYADIHSFC